MKKTEPNKKYTLDEACEIVSVMEPDVWENDEGPADWYAVVTDLGIVAYACNETLAFRIRLDLINQLLNPIERSLITGEEDA